MKIRFFEPTTVGRAIVPDMNFVDPCTDEGERCQADRTPWGGVELIFPKSEYNMEVEISEGGAQQNRYIHGPATMPKFHIEVNGSYEKQTFRAYSRKPIYDGQLRKRDFLWGQFGRQRLLSLHVEHEVVWPGIQVFNLKLGNTVRSVGDIKGDDVDGVAFFNRFMMDLPSRDNIVVFQNDTPFQSKGPGEVVLANGSLVLTPRRRWEIRFAVCTARTEAAARDAISYFDRGLVTEDGYMDKGGYGPFADFLCDMDWEKEFQYEGNEGWGAVRHMARDEMQRLQTQIETSPYLLPTRGSKQGNDPGGQDIKPHMGHFQVPEWYTCMDLMAQLQGNRMSEMVKPTDGTALTAQDMEAQHGTLPWYVKRTNGSEFSSTKSIPWEYDTGHAHSEGSSPEESWQRSHMDHDKSHACRVTFPNVDRVWSLNSTMAVHNLECRHAHYQYEYNTQRSDGNSLNAIEDRVVDGFGDGALGRQIGWPMYLAGVCESVASRTYVRENEKWMDRVEVVMSKCVSPSGGNRRREAPNWGWASPKPGLPDDSTELADQVFEMVYFAFGAYAIGAETSYRRVMEGLHQGELHRWQKFITYADREGGELYEAPHNVIDNTSGRSHQGNLCALGARRYRDEEYIRRAKWWARFDISTTDDAYVRHCLSNARSWAPQTHGMLNFWWDCNMIALVQQRMRSSNAV